MMKKLHTVSVELPNKYGSLYETEIMGILRSIGTRGEGWLTNKRLRVTFISGQSDYEQFVWEVENTLGLVVKVEVTPE